MLVSDPQAHVGSRGHRKAKRIYLASFLRGRKGQGRAPARPEMAQQPRLVVRWGQGLGYADGHRTKLRFKISKSKLQSFLVCLKYLSISICPSLPVACVQESEGEPGLSACSPVSPDSGGGDKTQRG